MSWICKRCETENSDEIKVCEVCDTPKPRKVAVKNTHKVVHIPHMFGDSGPFESYRSNYLYEKELKTKADTGDVNAMKELAKMYESDNIGFRHNEKESFKWYLKAAEYGDVESQYKVASCYYSGTMTLKDESESRKWFESAAKNGSQESRMLLDILFNPPKTRETGCFYMSLIVICIVVFSVTMLYE